MKDSQTVKSPCPHCGAGLDGALDPDGDAVPKEDDFSVCLYCGGVSVYGPGLILRKAEERDLAYLSEKQLNEIAAYKRLLEKKKNNG